MAAHAQPRLPLETDRIPVLPQGAAYLVGVLSDDRLDYRAIAAAVAHVPSVAARLLALANSAWSAPASPVTAIDAACSRLGLRVVRSASVALAIAQPFNPVRCPAFDTDVFWGAALLNAEAAALLAEVLLPDQVSTARTSGLLGNLGLLWLADALPEQTDHALRAASAQPPGALNRLLVEHCGLGYDEAGALLAAAWKLPETLREAIAGQTRAGGTVSALARNLNAASRLSAMLRHGAEPGEPDAALQALGVAPELQQGMFTRLAERRDDILEMAEVLFGRR